MKYFLGAVLCLGLAFSCASPFEHVEDRVQEIRLELQEDLRVAGEMLEAGEITQAEYDDLVLQAQQLAEAELEQIPGEVREIVEQNKEGIKQRGKGFVMSLLNLIMLVTLGGGAGALGTVGVQSSLKKRRSQG